MASKDAFKGKLYGNCNDELVCHLPAMTISFGFASSSGQSWQSWCFADTIVKHATVVDHMKHAIQASPQSELVPRYYLTFLVVAGPKPTITVSRRG